MLLIQTEQAWIEAVLADFNSFLLDHAACERKASSMAMSMVCHYPDKPLIVEAMTDIAVEELQHFRQVMRHVSARGLVMPPDVKDPYVTGLRKTMRKERDAFFLDRLLVASIVEARGHERFQLIANHVKDKSMQAFYQAIANSEEKHYVLFLDLAKAYFFEKTIEERLAELLKFEAEIIHSCQPRAALH